MPNTSTTGYTLVPSHTPFIDGNALWHIIIASVVAGAGLAIAFGLVLLGSKWGQDGSNGITKLSGWVLGLLAAAFCVFAIVVGIHIMVNPKASSPLKVTKDSSTSSMLLHHHGLARPGRAA